MQQEKASTEATLQSERQSWAERQAALQEELRSTNARWQAEVRGDTHLGGGGKAGREGIGDQQVTLRHAQHPWCTQIPMLVLTYVQAERLGGELDTEKAAGREAARRAAEADAAAKARIRELEGVVEAREAEIARNGQEINRSVRDRLSWWRVQREPLLKALVLLLLWAWPRREVEKNTTKQGCLTSPCTLHNTMHLQAHS